MSPTSARRRAAAPGMPRPALLQRPQSAVVHIGIPQTSRKRPPSRPLCGTRGKRWRPAPITSRRRLCGRCDAAVARAFPPVVLSAEDVALELALARTEADVVALRPAAIEANPVTIVDGVRLHAHYADALTRVRKAGR
jgi:hypothetical protein